MNTLSFLRINFSSLSHTNKNSVHFKLSTTKQWGNAPLFFLTLLFPNTLKHISRIGLGKKLFILETLTSFHSSTYDLLTDKDERKKQRSSSSKLH